MKVFTMSNYRSLSYSVILAVSDTFAYVAAVLLAYFTYICSQRLFDIVDLQFSVYHFAFLLIWIYLLYMVIIASQGLYTSRSPFWKESRSLVKAVTIVFILAFATVSFFKLSFSVSRFMLVFIWGYSIFFVISFRYILKEKLFCRRFFTKNAVIVGDPEEAERLAASFDKEHPLGFNVMGIVTVDDHPRGKIKHYKVLGGIKRVRDILITYDVSVAVFLPSAARYENISEIIGSLQLMLSQIVVIPGLGGLAFSNAEINQTLDTQLSYFHINNNLKSFFNRFVKRTVDIVLCLIFLPVLLIVTFIIGAIIKATSKGPVFYSHKRVGRNGRIIGILKFRSMYRDADKRLQEILARDPEKQREWKTSYKLKDDPRITPIGKFLRKTSLDELPQVFNVITGDMSLIGPRPVVPYELETYYKDYASYYLMVRPGITGLWQVSGRSDTSYDFRVARDTWYVLNWSPWLDIVILLKTPMAVFRQDGAY